MDANRNDLKTMEMNPNRKKNICTSAIVANKKLIEKTLKNI